MSDESVARELLRDGATCVLVHNNTHFVSRLRGIRPMLDVLDSGQDVRGFAAADTVVGRAAAFLFVLAGVASVYAQTVSRGALEVFAHYNIPVTYGTLTDVIINRVGTGRCPMEEAVNGISDPHAAFVAIREKSNSLQAIENRGK